MPLVPQQTKIVLRPLRNRVFHGGYSPPVSAFLRDYVLQPAADGHSINLSFDLELALSSHLWRGDTAKAVAQGTSARHNHFSILGYLIDQGIPCNVQIVGGLLDDQLGTAGYFPAAIRQCIDRHPDLFRLPPETIDALGNEIVESGIHGYSHRLFDNLSETDADAEIARTVSLIRQVLGRKPRFMSFTKNNCAHTHLLKRHGLMAWRGDNNRPTAPGEIPIGLWMAKPALSAREFGRLLRRLKSETDGFALHLWSHFHEMGLDDFRRYIDVAAAGDFHFRSA
ncbi:MAG: polysaccharide deacetylase family protein [Alphaproteobacteria bacterium]